MNYSKRKLIWALYITGMLITINTMYFNQSFWLIKLGISSSIMLIAIMIILKDVWNSSTENKWPWTLFLFFMGGIAIPIYMLNRKEQVTD
ncbi:MAG TPA: hypothetical protein PKJ62_02150 [Bacteroidia bacterium]|nr:hypothetical protein [Bacteroidia bacterium]HNS13257.1 hypothetical protein [Bacteroidia bacterium]